ncbi:hypothetical protein LX87_04361 [Larkinella arboricola]|uniref:Uncharacterized protein n=1 Tax=Larkinella arboricola TaxID=643671 RepID=A0A327WQI5_LARAB|nr:DUF6600 domain-containing protein [Larkinella arboricola]RAJ94474.1 hypothetical protein LX87_04361 [Larkinella arboricola]
MKTRPILPAFGLILFFFIALVGPQKTVAQPGVDLPVESFYDELAPYGQWVRNPQYGQVWMPEVEADFQPYATNGRWAVTEYGNTWVSDYDWGWAPFHYGRWLFDDYYGRWIWVPDSEWGPAWVSWRSGGGYYGWAPLGPGMSINVNININLPFNYWTFVPQAYFTSPRVYSYCIPRTRVVNVYHNTTIINNVYRYNNRSYGYGPRREEIERYTRRNVPVYRANEVVRRGTVGARGGNGSSYPSDRFSNRGEYNGNSRGTLAERNLNDNRSNRGGFPGSRGDNEINRNDGFNRRPGTMNRPDFGNRPNIDNDNRPDFSNRPGFDNNGIDRPNRNGNRVNRFESPSENRANPGYTPRSNSPSFERRSENRPFPQPDQSSRREGWSGNRGFEGTPQRMERSRESFPQRSGDQAPRHYQERQNSSNRGEGSGSRRGPQ